MSLEPGQDLSGTLANNLRRTIGNATYVFSPLGAVTSSNTLGITISGTIATSVARNNSGGEGEYFFRIEGPVVAGLYSLEVAVDGVQLAASPFLISMASVPCGPDRTADNQGVCRCRSGFVVVRSGCVGLDVSASLCMNIVFNFIKAM